MKKQKLSVAEIEETMLEMAERGLVCDSGKRRGGHIVWTLTPKGRQLGQLGQLTFADED
jgi:hypothetical protein